MAVLISKAELRWPFPSNCSWCLYGGGTHLRVCLNRFISNYAILPLANLTDKYYSYTKDWLNNNKKKPNLVICCSLIYSRRGRIHISYFMDSFNCLWFFFSTLSWAKYLSLPKVVWQNPNFQCSFIYKYDKQGQILLRINGVMKVGSWSDRITV